MIRRKMMKMGMRIQISDLSLRDDEPGSLGSNSAMILLVCAIAGGLGGKRVPVPDAADGPDVVHEGGPHETKGGMAIFRSMAK